MISAVYGPATCITVHLTNNDIYENRIPTGNRAKARNNRRYSLDGHRSLGGSGYPKVVSAASAFCCDLHHGQFHSLYAGKLIPAHGRESLLCTSSKACKSGESGRDRSV